MQGALGQTRISRQLGIRDGQESKCREGQGWLSTATSPSSAAPSKPYNRTSERNEQGFLIVLAQHYSIPGGQKNGAREGPVEGYSFIVLENV
jgi:hypothetical protein